MDLNEFQQRILAHGQKIDLKPTEESASDGAFLIQTSGLYKETLTQLHFNMQKFPGETDIYLAIPGKDNETSILAIGKVELNMDFYKITSKLLSVFNGEYFRVSVDNGELKTTPFDPYTLIMTAHFLKEKEQDAYFV